MRIVHVCKMTGVAGTETHLLALLPGLRAQGLDVRLIVLVEPDRPLDEYVARMNTLGVPTHTLPIHRDLDPALIGRLAGHLRDTQADAVHTHLIHADLHGALAALGAGTRRLYCSGHNDDPFRRRLPIRLFQAWFWRKANAGIAISEAVRQFMIRVEFAPPSKIRTIHYGLDANTMPTVPDIRNRLRAELGLAPDVLVVGSVCRLIEQKGLVYALQAFRHIADISSAHYVLVGDGPLREALSAQAVSLGIADRVHFLGWRPDARALYPAFDVFLMPSLWEGFGLVILEAMAARLPVIASRVSALPEIVADGVTGYHSVPGDPTSIATRLRTLLTDPHQRRAMGEAGYQRLRNEFSNQRMIDRTIELYRDTWG